MPRTWPPRLALVSLLPLACVAQAGDTVELYGRVDLSVNLARNTAKGQSRTLSSDSSFWGLRGSEHLGAGKRAYFKLESWFDGATGALVVPTQVFSREAYVGLDSGQAGSLQLGSQYAPGFWLTVRADPFLRSNTGPFLSLLQRSPTNPRGFSGSVNNSIQYLSPALAGASVRVLYAPAEDSPGSFVGAGAEYSGERLWAGLALESGKLSAASLGAVGNARVFQNTAAGLSYRWDALKLQGYALHNRVDGAPTVRGAMLGATVPAGASDVRVAYTRRTLADTVASNASLLALGYFHPLSRRTTLYTSIAWLNNQGNANFNTYPASMDLGVVPAGSNVRTVQFGIRHTF